MLDGHVPFGQLLVRRAGDAAWRRITFTDDIDIHVVNEPTLNPMLEHAELYYDLASIPLATRPLIVHPVTSGSQPSAMMVDFAYSNTQWP